MKRFIQALPLYVLLALLAACSNNDTPGNNMGISSSEQVRSLATDSDDTSEPISINDGAFVFDDSSDQAAPVQVN